MKTRNSLPEGFVNLRPGYELDIDGLRGIAVLLVVAFHAFPTLVPGGYIGVDVFFVISGFLITRNISSRLELNKFSFIDFYSKRTRRLFPSLLVVLLGSLIFGSIALLNDEFRSLGLHVFAGTVFASNFLLISESGYFDTASNFKPLLNLWSLSIEEQFYIFFPVSLFAMSKFKLSKNLCLAILVLVSAGLNIYFSIFKQNLAFYSIFSRSWELLLGGLLAGISPKFSISISGLKDFPNIRNLTGSPILYLIGILLISFGAFTFENIRSHASLLSALAAIGTFFLLLGRREDRFIQKVLSNRLLVFCGLISYPLYLWHWPILSFAHIFEGRIPSLESRIYSVVLSFIASILTYYFVETRLRYSKSKFVTPFLVLSMVTVGITGLWVYNLKPIPIISQTGEATNYLPESDLGENNWIRHGYNSQPECVEKYGIKGYCMVANSQRSPTVALIGDSHANHFYPGLAKKYAELGENLINVGHGGCSIFLDPQDQMDQDPTCVEILIKMKKLIEQSSIQTVILSNRNPFYIDLSDSKSEAKTKATMDPAVSDRFRSAVISTIQALSVLKKKVIFVIDLPAFNFNPSICLNHRPWKKLGDKSASCGESKIVIDERNHTYRKLVGEILSQFPTVAVWDPTIFLCDNNFCWAMKNGLLLYRNDNHLSKSGSFMLGSLFEDPN